MDKDNKNSIGKVPPQNLEAEQALLGSILIDKDSMIKISDLIDPVDFYSDKHKIIYETIVDLYRKREPIDILTMSNRLEEKEKLKDIGGRTYLVSLSNTVPTSSHILQYAEIVHKKAILRRLIGSASEITKISYDEEEEISLILDKAEQSLFSVSQSHQKQAFVPINNVLDEAFDRIDDIHKHKGKIRGVPTGFKDMDSKLAGLQNSDLIILAARPSVGKTTLALDIARSVGIHSKVPTALFSLEMSKEQLVDRMICSEANVDLWKMRTGRLSDNPADDDFSKIGTAIGTLSEAPIFIDDFGSANIMDIRTKSRRLQIEHGLGLIIVDYLQLMEGRTRTDNRVQEISEISRGLKQIAKELDVPVLALSQLSRGVEQRTPPIPKLSDLRESGSIEQDADIVMFIYREAVYKKDLEFDKKHIAEIHIAKHRNGPTGLLKLYFDEQHVCFKNLDKPVEGFDEPPPDMGQNTAPPAPPKQNSDTELPSFN